MPSIQSEVRELIQATLELIEEQRKSPFLASPEDCNDFRSWLQKSSPQSASALTPVPVPLPVPVVPPIQKAPPPSPRPEPKKSPPPPAPLILEEKPLLEDHFLDLRKLWAKINPSAPLFEEIPSDEIAKKIASRWKTKNVASSISILSYHEPPAQKALLEEIARAIDIALAPAQIVQAEPIEKEKQWEVFLTAEPLKLVIVCDYTLWQLGGLLQHYRENPAEQIRKLGRAAVFLLPDLSLYLKDPLLKRSLWKALCQTISS